MSQTWMPLVPSWGLLAGVGPGTRQRKKTELGEQIPSSRRRHFILRGKAMKRVIWTIDIDADSPREAAIAARQLQQDKESITHLFVVLDERGEKMTFDFDEEEGTA